MHKMIREFEAAQFKTQVPDFRPGDTVRVSVRIIEGDKQRIQDFQGVCIGRRGSGARETFTVRRVSYGVGIERVFPLHSPRVEGIKVVRRGKVRRAKLYYLRALRGKKARIEEIRRPGAVSAVKQAGEGPVEPQAGIEPSEETAGQEAVAQGAMPESEPES